MKQFHTMALLLALVLGIVSEWLSFPVLDTTNESNIFLGLKSIGYPEAGCLLMHSWIDDFLGSTAVNHSALFDKFPRSPTFHFIAVLQWILLYYVIFLILRFFNRLTNPRALKTSLVVTVVLLLTVLHYKFHADYSEYPRIRNDAEMLASSVGRLRAERDFKAGILRKFVFAGTNSKEMFLGTNSGPFQVWSPNFVDQPYEVSGIAFGYEMYSYNKTMDREYKRSLASTNAEVSQIP